MSGSAKQSTESGRSLRGVVYATVASDSARIDDPAAMHRLFAAVPQAERIRADLSQPLLVRKWHEPTGQSSLSACRLRDLIEAELGVVADLVN